MQMDTLAYKLYQYILYSYCLVNVIIYTSVYNINYIFSYNYKLYNHNYENIRRAPISNFSFTTVYVNSYIICIFTVMYENYFVVYKYIIIIIILVL